MLKTREKFPHYIDFLGMQRDVFSYHLFLPCLLCLNAAKMLKSWYRLLLRSIRYILQEINSFWKNSLFCIFLFHISAHPPWEDNSGRIIFHLGDNPIVLDPGESPGFKGVHPTCQVGPEPVYLIPVCTHIYMCWALNLHTLKLHTHIDVQGHLGPPGCLYTISPCTGALSTRHGRGPS